MEQIYGVREKHLTFLNLSDTLMCWCAVKKLLTHSLIVSLTENRNKNTS